MERATDVVREAETVRPMEVEFCLERIRHARRLLPFRVGGFIYKSERVSPATNTSVRILSVVSLADGSTFHYRLDELRSLSVDDVHSVVFAEAVAWCAVGRPSPVPPAAITFCALHEAECFCLTTPLFMCGGLASYLTLDNGNAPRDIADRDIASALKALANEVPKEAGGVILGSSGYLLWDDSLEKCVDRTLITAQSADEVLTRIPLVDEESASVQERSVAPMLRGLFGNGGPVVLARIGAPYERILWSYDGLIESAAPLPTVVVKADGESDPTTLTLPDGEVASAIDVPLVAIVPQIGAWALHRDSRTARTAAALFERYIAIAAQLGKAIPADAVPPEHWASVAPDPPMPLTGKTALVTGAGSGIGLATVKRLQAEGACVYLVDLNAAKLEEELNVLRDAVGDDYVDGVACDVREAASVQAAFDRAVERWGGLDILVNCAGLSLSRSIEETLPEEYDLQNDVMPRGSFLCSRAAARILRLQGYGGDIIYIASKNGLFAGPNNVAYGTAKAAQIHQARLVAAELASIHVRVNIVNPDAVVRGSGIFSQGWGDNRAKAYGVKTEDLGKYYASRSLLKEEILPEDIAAAVFVLVGPELRKSTGLMINVDGGFVPAMLR